MRSLLLPLLLLNIRFDNDEGPQISSLRRKADRLKSLPTSSISFNRGCVIPLEPVIPTTPSLALFYFK